MADLPTTYFAGTVTVGAGSTTVTGVGTNWITAGIEAGDIFWAAGLSVRVAAVVSATSITLAYPWPGAALAAANYEIRFTPDATRVLASAREVLSALTNGNLSALAGLATAANKLPYYTGSGTAALADLTSQARTLLASTALSHAAGTYTLNGFLAGTAVVSSDTDVTAGRLLKTAPGPAQAFRRGNLLGTVSQASGVPTGAVIERGSNANGEYVRFADGTQICVSPDFTSVDVTTATGSIYRNAAPLSWTPPASFASVNSISGGVISQANSQTHWGAMRAVSSTELQITVFSPVSITARSVRAFAIGRWF